MNLLYLPFEEELDNTELGVYHTWGIRCGEIQGGSIVLRQSLSDVSTDGAFVAELARRCTELQLAPCQLLDVVLDTLP